MRRAFLYLALFSVLLSPQPSGAHHTAQHPPDILREVGIEQRLQAQIPLDLVFRDETGRQVQLGGYFSDKPVILTLAYYNCPNLCTLVLNGLVRALRALSFTAGEQFTVVTLSIDPRDTPALATAKKAQYLRQYASPAAATGWHFLTGDLEAIQRLTDAVGFRYAYDAEQDQFAHASGLMLLTPQGVLARYFYGIEYAPKDLRLGLVEAAANRIGSPIDQLLLYCYHYDPRTGRYSLGIITGIRLAGLVTVLTLGAFLGLMFRRERGRQTKIAVGPCSFRRTDEQGCEAER